MKNLIIAAIPVALITACAPATPVVSDFNGSSVKIQRSTLVSDEKGAAEAKSKAEALRICKASGKTRVEYASTRTLPDYNVEDLFLCLN